MVNFKMLSETEFRTDKSDYAKNLRSIYGDDGYQKYSAKINSIIEEGKEKTKKIAPDNPLKKSLEARITYLEAEYARAIADTRKKGNIFNYLTQKHKSGTGMLNFSNTIEKDTFDLAKLNYSNSMSKEDGILDALHEAYIHKGMYNNFETTI